MGKYFGTDGVRGVGAEDLSNELAYALGRFGAYVLTRDQKERRPRILVAKDTRISSDMLEASLSAGAMSVGVDVALGGVLPTPAVAFLVRDNGFDAGIVISASHNPFEFNGIKFFSSTGYKLPDEVEEEIEAYIDGEKTIEETFSHENLGRYISSDLLTRNYQKHLLEVLHDDLTGMKIALDCANGATSALAQEVFEFSGAQVHIIHHSPDGININDQCGSTHMEDLSEIVRSGEYDLGLAFDGDGDRCLAVDDTGEIVDGDRIMAIIGLQMKQNSLLKQDTIVATVMSNIGFRSFASQQGIHVLQAPVGDRYVLEEMLAGGYTLGGEQSGHLIFIDHSTTGDGMLTGLLLCEAVKKSGKPLSYWREEIPRYPQVIVNARVPEERKKSYLENEVVREAVERFEKEFNQDGRVLIRPSGTEPLLRVMLEGKEEEVIRRKAQELAALMEEQLNE